MVSVILNSYKDDQSQLREAIIGYQTQAVPCEIILSTVIGDPAAKTGREMDVRVVQNGKPGIYYQLNNAIKFAVGDWFCVASGNDKALPNKLIDELKLLRRTKKLICYSAFYATNKDLKIINTCKFHPYDYKVHLRGNFMIDNALTNMQLLRKYLPFREEWGNDAFWDMWLRIYEGEGNVFVYNPVPNFLYRLDGRGRHFQKKKNKAMWDRDEQNRQRMLASHGAKYIPRKFK